MPVPLSVLDQSPIVHGASPRDAVLATIALAKWAEKLGYARYWLAEHHAMPSLADSSPEVLLARLTGETKRIRLGSGGIMLPHYSAYKVAEVFSMLHALAPDRVDLGVGRAPGGGREVSIALRSGNALDFPNQIQEIQAYFAGESRLVAQPSAETSPALWVLGSSDYGARLAAQLGLPYSFGQFIGGDYPEVTRMYRDQFQPSAQLQKPYVMVTIAAIIADTDEEADVLSLPSLLHRMRRLRGIIAPAPSLDEAIAYPWTEREKREIIESRNMVIGSPATARAKIEDVVERYAADEIMIVTIAPDYASRMRSYELLSEAFAPIPA
jgi:luciferase family oxidoreductase group 1